MAAPTKTKEYLPTIDGWRAIAIGAVLVCHRQTELFGEHGMWPNPTLKRFADEGGHGVDLFFAISGLLITRRLLAEVRERGTPSLAAFYVRRAFRILPAVGTYLAVISCVALVGKWSASRADLLASLFFYRNYVHGHLLTEHLWSLAVEEHFYLIWPVLFGVLLKLGRGKVVIWPIIVVALGVAAWRFVYFAQNGEAPLFAPNPTFRTDVRFDALLWGCVAAIILDDAAVCVKLDRWLNAPIVGVLAIAYAASGALPFASSTWVKALLGPLLLVATMRHPRWAFSRALESRVLRWVGHLSYSLYLFQQVVVGLTPTFGIGVFSFVVCCFALAAICYYVIEKPLVRLGYGVSARVTRSEPTKLRVRDLATFAVVGIVFVTTYTLAMRTARAFPNRMEVQLFSETEFRGAMTVLGPGAYGPWHLGAVGNDATSSMIVGAGVRARVCVDGDNDGFRAGCIDIAPGAEVSYVGDLLNDQISAVDVTAR